MDVHVSPEDPLRDEAGRRRRSRAVVLALILGAFVVLIYAVTIAKMSVLR
jgi:hypothetical protein